jgi:hypothetical protein
MAISPSALAGGDTGMQKKGCLRATPDIILVDDWFNPNIMPIIIGLKRSSIIALISLSCQ